MFSKDLRIGDYIMVGDYSGVIVNVTFLKILIKSNEGDYVYIPNTIILNNEVINYSKSSQKRIVFDFELDIKLYKYLKNLERHLILKIKKEFDDVIYEDGFRMKVGKIYETKADIVVEITVKKYNLDLYERVRKYASLVVIDYVSKKQKK